MEPTIPLNESKLMSGSVTELAQAADWDAAYWLTKVGPERAGALLTYARMLEQSIQDRIRARAAELARIAHQNQIERWEQEALERSLAPATQRREAPRKPEVVQAATTEDLL